MFARIAADHILDDAGTYYDYVHKTHRKALRPGNVEGLKPFREFYRQAFVLGSERSTILFTEKLVALFPVDARPWILLWQSGVRCCRTSRSKRAAQGGTAPAEGDRHANDAIRPGCDVDQRMGSTCALTCDRVRQRRAIVWRLYGDHEEIA